MPRTADTTILKQKLAELHASEQPLTKNDLGISDYFVGKLTGARHVKVVGTRKVVNAETGKADRGHPANLYGLTPNGRKVAKRYLARNAQAQEAQTA